MNSVHWTQQHIHMINSYQICVARKRSACDDVVDWTTLNSSRKQMIHSYWVHITAHVHNWVHIIRAHVHTDYLDSSIAVSLFTSKAMLSRTACHEVDCTQQPLHDPHLQSPRVAHRNNLRSWPWTIWRQGELDFKVISYKIKFAPFERLIWRWGFEHHGTWTTWITRKNISCEHKPSSNFYFLK